MKETRKGLETMPKLFVIMGKSATGKDTIYQDLLKEKKLSLRPVLGYTTRPIRDGEQDGVEYYFVTVTKMKQMEQQGRIIECRCYHTIYGEWYYFTASDGQIDLKKSDYLMIATLEGYEKLQNYFGSDKVIPIYLEVEDGIRLSRAIMREQKQTKPKYAELCRRYLADETDFSEKNLSKVHITKRYQNIEEKKCLLEIVDAIQEIILKSAQEGAWTGNTSPSDTH